MVNRIGLAGGHAAIQTPKNWPKAKDLNRMTHSTSSSKKAAGTQDLAVARRVLTTEADALKSLAGALDQSFIDAIDTLAAVKGRIIVSGLGKSGHVARKMAATFASTGSPAFFVHPAEASHGDLGMITQNDVLLMASNSGENRELRDLIGHAKRFGIALIGISSRAESTLMSASTIQLLLPPAPEACPMGMAPTTSSTMMLALGDALAVALMERRGFSQDDYRVLHPGGELGKSLVRVADIMHGLDDTPLVNASASTSDALHKMTEKQFGCVGIINDEGYLVGIFTDGDLRRQVQDDTLGATAGDIMIAKPKTIRFSALAVEAVGFMNTSKITSLFVVSDEEAGSAKLKPLGIVHMHDCLKAGIA